MPDRRSPGHSATVSGMAFVEPPGIPDPGLVAFTVPGAAPGPEPLSRPFTVEHITELRHAVEAYLRRAGLDGVPLEDFVVAVHELVTNAVRHGGGAGRLELRRDGDTLVCDVTDHGSGFGAEVPAPTGPPPAEAPGGRGLWLARRLSDTMLVSDSPDGVTVSLTVCLPTTAPVGAALPAVEPAPTTDPG